LLALADALSKKLEKYRLECTLYLEIITPTKAIQHNPIEVSILNIQVGLPNTE